MRWKNWTIVKPKPISETAVRIHDSQRAFDAGARAQPGEMTVCRYPYFEPAGDWTGERRSDFQTACRGSAPDCSRRPLPQRGAATDPIQPTACLTNNAAEAHVGSLTCPQALDGARPDGTGGSNSAHTNANHP